MRRPRRPLLPARSVLAHQTRSTAAATAVRTIATTEVDSDLTVNLADAIKSPPVGLRTETTTGKSPDVRAEYVDVDGLHALGQRHLLRVRSVKERKLVARQVDHHRHAVRDLAYEGYRDRRGLRGEPDGVGPCQRDDLGSRCDELAELRNDSGLLLR